MQMFVDSRGIVEENSKRFDDWTDASDDGRLDIKTSNKGEEEAGQAQRGSGPDVAGIQKRKIEK